MVGKFEKCKEIWGKAKIPWELELLTDMRHDLILIIMDIGHHFDRMTGTRYNVLSGRWFIYYVVMSIVMQCLEICDSNIT